MFLWSDLLLYIIYNVEVFDICLPEQTWQIWGKLHIKIFFLFHYELIWSIIPMKVPINHIDHIHTYKITLNIINVMIKHFYTILQVLAFLQREDSN